MNRLFLFDLDGTLLDTLEDLASSGNQVLAQRGFETHPVDAYRAFIGNGMVNLVRDIFPEGHRPAEGEETEAMLREYRDAYAENWQNTTVPFPGIGELLDQLQEADVALGVLSNKAHDFTVKCVETFLGNWEWDVVLGARDEVPRKPDPAGAIEAAQQVGVDPADCYFIGDSDVDMLTAVNAEMHPIGVSWGFRPVEELRASGAVAIVESPDQLLQWAT